MTDENNMADVTTEEEEFENESGSEAGDGTSTDSPTENNEDGENGDSGAGDKNQQEDDKDIPFHEHPRWKQREQEWQNRFNDQETRHTQAIEDLRKEFGGKKSNDDRPEKVPKWFGGNQEQWDEYCAHENEREERAVEKALSRITEGKTAQDKAIKEATDFMRDEISAIESDKNLNPKGDKIDPNKLLKIVMDNDLVDSQGRWNYRAGYRLMNQGAGSTQTTNVADRKKMAAVTTSTDHKGNDKPSAFKTSEDFKKAKPW